MPDSLFNEDDLRALYERAVELPNRNSPAKGFIKCPACGEKIFLIPSLRAMSEAIENHVQKHKTQMKANPIKAQQAAIFIRLSLMEQVLERLCKIQLR